MTVVAIKDITFLSVLTESKTTEIFALVEFNEQVALVTAHFFSVPKGQADILCKVCSKPSNDDNDDRETGAL